MSAPRWLVAGATLVVASPLLGLLRAGDVDVPTALVRVAVCAAACWVALTLVWTFLLPGPSSGPSQGPAPGAGPAPDPGAAGAVTAVGG